MTELALLTGTVLAWNHLTGENTIKIGDDMICNLISIAGLGAVFRPLDTVVLCKRNARYFVLGRHA